MDDFTHGRQEGTMNDFIHGRHIGRQSRSNLHSRMCIVIPWTFAGNWSGNFKWIPAQRLYTLGRRQDTKRGYPGILFKLSQESVSESRLP